MGIYLPPTYSFQLEQFLYINMHDVHIGTFNTFPHYLINYDVPSNSYTIIYFLSFISVSSFFEFYSSSYMLPRDVLVLIWIILIHIGHSQIYFMCVCACVHVYVCLCSHLCVHVCARVCVWVCV
jgi:hypothetical protein